MLMQRSANHIVNLALQLSLPVKSWDGGENSIDSCVGGKHSRKRPRDDWDEELDRGKVRDVRIGGH